MQSVKVFSAERGALGRHTHSIY